MSKIVNQLIKDGYLKTDAIISAFSDISRIEFVPEDLELQAEVNIDLPIGYGQVISQPLTVAFMLELLDPKEGHNIMDIGSGSGWTTALLSHVVGENGKVIALERISKLSEIGQNNTDKFGYVKKGIAEFYCQDGSQGFSAKAPYDRILISAETKTIPEELKKQLKIGGKMVVPTGSNITYLEKKGEDDFYKEEFPGFAFSPLIVG